MTRCIKCGSELREGAKFCNKCGAKVTPIPPEVTAKIEILRRRIEKDPLEPRLYIEIGTIYLENGLFQESLIEYQKAVSIDNSYFDAHLKSGEVYLELKELEKAEKSYQKALSLNPNSADARLGLFRVHHLKDKPEQAIEEGEEIIKADPGNLEVHKVLKEMYVKKGIKEKVFKELEIIATLTPDDKEVLKELARFYAEKNESEKEGTCYEKILELDPQDIDARFAIGRWFYLRGDYQKTIENLKKILHKVPSELKLRSLLYLSLAYINLQQLDGARVVADLISVVDYESLTAENRKLLGEIYFRIGSAVLQNKDFSTAISYLDKAKKCEPQNAEYKKQLDNAKAEKTMLEKTGKKKIIAIVSGIVTVAILVIVSWYLSHGKIEFRITPAESVEVYIDGKLLKEATSAKPRVIVSPSLFFGSHKIKLQKFGYENWDKDIKVGLGKTVIIEAMLVPIYGLLKVNSIPSGADIYLDGKLIGKTPLLNDKIPIGDHKIETQESGFIPFISNVTILKNEMADLGIIDLTEYAHLIVNSSPMNATVFIDGKHSNQTPLKIDVPPGDHEILIKKDYYRSASEKLLLTEGEKRSMAISLPQFQGIWEGKWQPWVYEQEFRNLQIEQEGDELTIKCDGLTRYCKVNDKITLIKPGDDTLVFYHPSLDKVLIIKGNRHGFEIRWEEDVSTWGLKQTDYWELLCFITSDGEHMVGIATKEQERKSLMWGSVQRDGKVEHQVYFDFKK